MNTEMDLTVRVGGLCLSIVLASAFSAGFLAYMKGRSAKAGAQLGAFLPIVGVIWVLFWPANQTVLLYRAQNKRLPSNAGNTIDALIDHVRTKATLAECRALLTDTGSTSIGGHRLELLLHAAKRTTEQVTYDIRTAALDRLDAIQAPYSEYAQVWEHQTDDRIRTRLCVWMAENGDLRAVDLILRELRNAPEKIDLRKPSVMDRHYIRAVKVIGRLFRENRLTTSQLEKAQAIKDNPIAFVWGWNVDRGVSGYHKDFGSFDHPGTGNYQYAAKTFSIGDFLNYENPRKNVHFDSYDEKQPPRHPDYDDT